MIRVRPVRSDALATATTFLLLVACAPSESGAPSGSDEGTPAATAGADVPPAAAGPLVDHADAISADRIREHMRALAHDSMRGRGPGSPGGQMAADYVAAAFRDAGLEPVAGTYFEPVPMVGSTPTPSSASLTWGEVGAGGAPAYLEDFVVWAGDAEAARSRADGELVFVGYGIEAPEADWSDYGVDVRGKVVMILVNDPPAPADEPDLFGGRAMTYYGRWTYKYEEAARQGAAGALVVHTTEEAGYGWNVVRSSWSGEQFSLPADPGAPAPVTVEGWVTRDVAEAMLAAGGHDLAALTEEAGSRDFTPVETGVPVSLAVDSEVRRVETSNVIGLLPGSERPGEVVTITSHYDHLGVGDPVDGDSIYNGAYDNASGVALMLAVAEAFGSAAARPARSLLFIATGAEEQGLLGAAWYAQNPLFPLETTVAEINVDGANLWGETDDLIVMGAGRSALGPVAERRAAELGLRLEPDAEPEKGFFFRSDHFPFAKAGIPSLYIEHGRDYRGQPEGWGQEIQDQYSANAYHAPADEFSEDFVFDGAVQQAKVVYLVAVDIAESEAWPNWNPDSEFRAARDRMMGGGG